jgi:hypothetical protein
MYIITHDDTVRIPNPYYSPGNRGIESEYVHTTQSHTEIFITEDSFKDFLSSNTHMLQKIRCFRAEEIFPKVVTTVNIDF